MPSYPNNSLPLLPIDTGEVHVWFAFPQEITDIELLGKYRLLLDAREQKKCARYKFEKHRHVCLVTRALIRYVLSRYAKKAPEDWRFSINKKGKPDIIPDQNIPPLRFNVTHTKGLIACAVTLGHDVGIDAENIEAKTANLDIADRFFSPAEISELHSLPAARQETRFFDYWTLKESYIKARGKGLSIPLDQFTFMFDKNKKARISFGLKIKDDPDAWQFFRIKPAESHIAAVAVHTGKPRDVGISFRETIPFHTEQPTDCKILA